MEQHHGTGTAVGEDVERLLDLLQRGHAGREQNGLPGLRDGPEQHGVVDVHRGDLDGRHVEGRQQLHLVGSERRRHEVDAQLGAVTGDVPVHVGGELIGIHHLLQSSEVLLLVAVLGVPLVLGLRDERAIGERLELHGVGAVLLGALHHGAAELHVAVVVGADLCDEVGAVLCAHGPVADRHRAHSVRYLRSAIHSHQRNTWRSAFKACK